MTAPATVVPCMANELGPVAHLAWVAGAEAQPPARSS